MTGEDSALSSSLEDMYLVYFLNYQCRNIIKSADHLCTMPYKPITNFSRSTQVLNEKMTPLYQVIINAVDLMPNEIVSYLKECTLRP